MATEINLRAFSDLLKAEEEYLIANGWVQVGPGKYRVPAQFGILANDIYLHWHAVQTQRARDSDQLRG